MKTNAEYPSIRQMAREGPVGEHSLRLMLKRGELPGFYVGRNYRIDKKAFLNLLSTASAEGRQLV